MVIENIVSTLAKAFSGVFAFRNNFGEVPIEPDGIMTKVKN